MPMINYNPNDPGVKTIEDIMVKLAEVNDAYYNGELDDEEREIELEEIKKLLENAISSRFGFNVGIMYAPTFGIIPIFNTEIRPSILKNLKKTKTISKTVYKNFIKNIKKFIEFSKKNMLILDLEKARIENMPKDIKLTMLFDFDAVANNPIPQEYMITHEIMGQLTPKEVTAVLLHEIGHVFTLLEMYNMVNHVTIRLLEALFTNNKKEIKKLGLVFDKDNPEYVKRKENKEFIFRIVEEADKKLKDIRLSKEGTEANDSEYEADAFAVRFGYGKYLLSALVKFKDLDKATIGRFVFFSFVLYLLENAFLFYFLTLFYGLPVAILIVLVISFIIISFNIINFLVKSIKTRIPNDDEHGDPYIRFENIKLQMIQLLRKYKLPPNEIKSIIEQIDYATEMLKKLDKSIYSSMVGVIHHDTRLKRVAFNVNTEETLTRILDKMINNILYYHRDKFKYTLSQEEIVETYVLASGITIAEERLIDPQLNDPFVKDMIEYFRKAQEDADLINLFKKPDLKKINELLKVQEPLRKMVFKRFGIDILPIPSVWIDVLFGGDIGNASVPFLGSQKSSLKHAMFNDNFLVLRLMKEDESKFNKSVNNLLNNKVTIDFKNAKIKGLEGIRFPILFTYGTDFMQLSSKHSRFALTPEEITAVLLHEIGHLFTYISSLNDTVATNKILLDNILSYTNKIEEASKSNIELTEEQKKEIEKLLSTTSSLVSHIVSTIKNNIVRSVNSFLPAPIRTNKLVDKAIVSSKFKTDEKLNKVNFFMTDSEEIADDFAVKFGLGGKLASGLHTMIEGRMGIKFSFLFPYITSFSLIEIIKHMLFMGVRGVGELANKIVLNIVFSIHFDILSFLIDLIFGQYFTYDKFLDRIDLMKTQTIKLLRENKVPKDLIEIIVREIENIKKTREQVITSGADNLFIKLLLTYNPNLGKPLNPTIRYRKMLNEIINNEVYLNRERMRLLDS